LLEKPVYPAPTYCCTVLCVLSERPVVDLSFFHFTYMYEN
jgi:hypothetical protein